MHEIGVSRELASSFTVVKGAMVEETYAVFAAWDFNRSKRENLDRLRAENFIGAGSATWLRDVAKVLNRRFDPDTRDRPWSRSPNTWKPWTLSSVAGVQASDLAVPRADGRPPDRWQDGWPQLCWVLLGAGG